MMPENLQECVEPTPPPTGSTPQEWADYFLAYGEYLECVAESSGKTTFKQRRASFVEFTMAARKFRRELPPS